MPWTCTNPACGETVQLDSLLHCPYCDHGKTAWSMDLNSQAEEHRTFVVARKKVEGRRGEVVVTELGVPELHTGVSWHKTKQVAALAKSEALACMQAKGLPRPQDLLQIRLRPAQAQTEWDLEVAVNFEKREVEEHRFVFEGDRAKLDENGSFALSFVCVYGPEDTRSLRFPRVYVLDVSEDTSLGHAPELEISGLRSRPQALELVSSDSARAEFEVEILDNLDRPVGGQAFRLEAEGEVHDGVTDSAGRAKARVSPDAKEGLLSLWPDDPNPVAWLLGVGDDSSRPVHDTVWVNARTHPADEGASWA